MCDCRHCVRWPHCPWRLEVGTSLDEIYDVADEGNGRVDESLFKMLELNAYCLLAADCIMFDTITEGGE